MPSGCQKKREFLLAWQSATEAYAKAVNELSKRIGQISEDEYRELRVDAETARRMSVARREAFERHVEDHGCDRQGSVRQVGSS
jgi:hypothetical protein